MNNNIIIIDSFFSDEEVDLIESESKNSSWELTTKSKIEDIYAPFFWHKNIASTKVIELFKNKIESGIKKSIEILRLHYNGQAHGQCGTWHKDVKGPEAAVCFTLVYFPYGWKPEYGGHLVVQDDTIVSILPEFNKAVIFNAGLYHVGLEPTIHCKRQRESIACLFKIVL